MKKPTTNLRLPISLDDVLCGESVEMERLEKMYLGFPGFREILIGWLSSWGNEWNLK